MPLSEHEQRLLDQIERSLLDSDPKFASAVRASDPRKHAWRRVVVAALVFGVGAAIMVFGLVANVTPGGVPVLGLAGFVVMFSAALLAAQAFVRTSKPGLRVVDPASGTTRTVPNTRKAPRRSGGGSVSRGSLIDRLEQRWRRRRGEGGGL
ncbi:MAG: DUF3040 domain-containing protein [Mycobacteriales bacterium]